MTVITLVVQSPPNVSHIRSFIDPLFETKVTASNPVVTTTFGEHTIVAHALGHWWGGRVPAMEPLREINIPPFRLPGSQLGSHPLSVIVLERVASHFDYLPTLLEASRRRPNDPLLVVGVLSTLAVATGDRILSTMEIQQICNKLGVNHYRELRHQSMATDRLDILSACVSLSKQITPREVEVVEPSESVLGAIIEFIVWPILWWFAPGDYREPIFEDDHRWADKDGSQRRRKFTKDEVFTKMQVRHEYR